MKKIDTSNIAGLAKAPFIKNTHDHIKESIQETTSNIVKGLLGSYTAGDVIILYGCVVTDNIPGTSEVTAGAIYYNDEIYEVEANASITSPANTLVWDIETVYIAADSTLTWSDGIIRNLHQIDRFVLSNGTTGSGIADFDGATVKTLASAVSGAPTTMTLLNSYVAASACKYRKDASGNVFIWGTVTSPAVPASTEIFQLPVGYWPTTNRYMTVPQVGGTEARYVLIGTDGRIYLRKASDGGVITGGTDTGLHLPPFNVND